MNKLKSGIEFIRQLLLIPVYYFAIFIIKWKDTPSKDRKSMIISYFRNIIISILKLINMFSDKVLKKITRRLAEISHKMINIISHVVQYYILQPIFFVILNMMGWTVPSKDEISVEKGTYTIHVFSHTSKMDFFLSAMYKLAQPEYGNNSYVLLMPGLYNKFTTPILNSLSFLKATHSKDRGQGLVNKIVEIAKESSDIHIGMSPEGTLVASPWKSGYYWIGKGIKVELPDQNVKFRVTGFDYHKKELAFYGRVTVPSFNKKKYDKMNMEERNEYFKDEKKRIEEELQDHMSYITPLYPEKSFVKPRLIYPEFYEDEDNEEEEENKKEEDKVSKYTNKLKIVPTIVNREKLVTHIIQYVAVFYYIFVLCKSPSLGDYIFTFVNLSLITLSCIKNNLDKYADLERFEKRYSYAVESIFYNYIKSRALINLNYWSDLKTNTYNMIKYGIKLNHTLFMGCYVPYIVFKYQNVIRTDVFLIFSIICSNTIEGSKVIPGNIPVTEYSSIYLMLSGLIMIIHSIECLIGINIE